MVSTVPRGGTSKLTRRKDEGKRLGAGPSSVELSATPKSFAGRGSPGEKLQRYQRDPHGAWATKFGLGPPSGL